MEDNVKYQAELNQAGRAIEMSFTAVGSALKQS